MVVIKSTPVLSPVEGHSPGIEEKNLPGEYALLGSQYSNRKRSLGVAAIDALKIFEGKGLFGEKRLKRNMNSNFFQSDRRAKEPQHF